VLVALLLLFTKLKKALAKDYHRVPRITALGLFVLSFVGVWLGFIVLDGATYLLLVLILLFGYDLPHANALKVFLLVTTTLVPIALFARAGNIWWTEGLLLSVGSLVGGHFWRQAIESRESANLGVPHSGGGDHSRTDPSCYPISVSETGRSAGARS